MQHNFIQICSLVHPQQNLNDLWGRSGSLPQQQQQQRRLNTKQRNNFHVLHSPFISRSESLLPSLMLITFWRARRVPHLAVCLKLLCWSPREATRYSGTLAVDLVKGDAHLPEWAAEISALKLQRRGHAWITSVGLSGTGPKGAGLQPGFGRDRNRKFLLLLHQQQQRIKANKAFSPLLIGFGLSLLNSLPLVPFAPMGGSDRTAPNWRHWKCWNLIGPSLLLQPSHETSKMFSNSSGQENHFTWRYSVISIT